MTAPVTFNGVQHQISSDLASATPVLEQLQPYLWRGLVGASDTSAMADELRTFTPSLTIPVQVAGRLGQPLRQRGFLNPTGNPDEFEIQPSLIVWPTSVPTFGGVSLVNLPRCIAKPGSYIWLRVTWVVNKNYHLSSRNAEIIISTSQDLDASNATLQQPITGPNSVNWYHYIGRISAEGGWIPQGITFPFTPPEFIT